MGPDLTQVFALPRLQSAVDHMTPITYEGPKGSKPFGSSQNHMTLQIPERLILDELKVIKDIV